MSGARITWRGAGRARSWGHARRRALEILYAIALVLHSLVRWAFVGLGAALLATSLHGWASSRAWSSRDERLANAFVGIADLQLLLGLVLWLAVSPLPSAFFRGDRSWIALFFGVIHPIAMLGAIASIHTGRSLGRALTGAPRHRVSALSLMLAALLVIAAVPWPWLAVGRPLLRSPF